MSASRFAAVLGTETPSPSRAQSTQRFFTVLRVLRSLCGEHLPLAHARGFVCSLPVLRAHPIRDHEEAMESPSRPPCAIAPFDMCPMPPYY